MSESLNKARELLKTVKVMLESPSQFSHREILGHVEDVEAALSRSAEPTDEKEVVRMRVKQYDDRIPCGNCGHVHLGMCPRCNNCPQIVPPKLESRSAPSGQPRGIPRVVEALWELILACDNQALITPFGGLLSRKLAEGREAFRQFSIAQKAEPPTSPSGHPRRNVVGAKPLCLDCHSAGIINCSHFDDCDGKWVYVAEPPTSSAPEVKA